MINFIKLYFIPLIIIIKPFKKYKAMIIKENNFIDIVTIVDILII